MNVSLALMVGAGLMLQGVVAADSVGTLGFREFLDQVMNNHPVVAQARLLEQIADGGVQGARGAFDPKLSATWDRKLFGGTEYFEYLDASLKLPTRYGFDFKLGFERTSGSYFNPERRTPMGGLFSAGISVPLGQRMVTDERRAAVAQATAMRSYARGERISVVNKLLFAATEVYAEWFATSERASLAREGVALAEFRLTGTRNRVRAGESAAVDTIEATLEVQRRRVQLREAEMTARNAGLIVESMLWNAQGTAVSLASDAQPQAFDGGQPVGEQQLQSWLVAAQRAHPDAVKVQAKVRDAEAARALAMQQVFVPDARVELSGLSSETFRVGDQQSSKIGASLELPLLFRKERGKFAATQGKSGQLELEQSMVARAIDVGILTTGNEMNTVVDLMADQRVIVANATLLRDAEQRRFLVGESTLFVVNARERTVLDERAKLIALEAKYLVTRAKLAVAIGAFAALGQ